MLPYFLPRRLSRPLLNIFVILIFVLMVVSFQIILLSPCQVSSDMSDYEHEEFIPTHREYYNSPLREQPMKPFEDAEQHYVLVLSYQRSGSSFFGQLFNQNKNIHFLYEPLDSVYVSLYGTPEGWNVPTDITSFWNGTERLVPDFENEAVGSTLYNLFTCNHGDLATETLIHRFWKQFATYQMTSYKLGSCVTGAKVTLEACRKKLQPKMCGSRLGDPALMDKCHKLIRESKFRWGGNISNIELQEQVEAAIRGDDPTKIVARAKTEREVVIPEGPVKLRPIINAKPVKTRNLLGLRAQPVNRKKMSPRLPKNNDSEMLCLMKYHQCLKESRQKVATCEKVFKMQCDMTPVRAIKTVRATMENAQYLLAKLPNLRVIHLIRDPRAVVVSRSEFDGSGSGNYAGRPMDMAKEAMMLCRQMVRDIKLRKQLQQMYPGQIMEIIYDDFVLKPMEYTELVYKFANVTLPTKLKTWVTKQTSSHSNKKKNSTYIATKWQEKMSYRVSKDVTEACEEFFKYATYEWPE